MDAITLYRLVTYQDLHHLEIGLHSNDRLSMQSPTRVTAAQNGWQHHPWSAQVLRLNTMLRSTIGPPSFLDTPDYSSSWSREIES